MRNLRGRVRHSLRLALALVCVFNCVALPVFSASVASRPAKNLSVNSLPDTPLSQTKSPAPSAPAVTKIAFASDRDGNFEIYSMSADGGGQTRLTENTAEDFSPAWAPEGSRLAFVSNRDGNNEIYVMNADGTGQTRLTNNSADDLSPVWSPNGAQIAFTSRRNGNDEIYLMSAIDGSNQTNLTGNVGDDLGPSFSPSGAQIAFASNRDIGQYEIYKMNADGTGVVRLTTDADPLNPANDSNPVWSPSKITFQTDRTGDDEIFAISPSDGSLIANLSSNPASDIDPSRSSDGSKVAFATTRDGDFEIYLMNADGSNQARLTNNPASDIQPAIQPQGTLPAPSATSIQFSSANYSVAEDGTSATITVTRTGNTTAPSTVDFGTTNGTASSRTDYLYSFGTLRFAAGETSKTFNVLIVDDVYIENNETLTLSLSNPTGASLGNPAGATLTIIDNDTATPTAFNNPIDNAAFFVRQQYLDFLNRVPDQGGLDFWVGRINACNGDPACTADRRVEVAAAFFQSQEFQETGFFVYRLYLASFGRQPTYDQFIRDRSRVIAGANLEQSKTDLINDFITRPEFNAALPAGLTSAQYVDALNANTGNSLTQAERNALVAGLNNGTQTRATVLRQVVDNAAFRAREFNPAFVLMQYFGFLERDPDPGGYQFWLGILNRTNDPRSMVAAFISSQEYRMRFGP